MRLGSEERVPDEQAAAAGQIGASAAAQPEPRTVAAERPQKIPMPLQLLGASGLLLFSVVALFVIVGYLLRAWRRAVGEPLRPTRLEEDAWARKPLVSRDPGEADPDA